MRCSPSWEASQIPELSGRRLVHPCGVGFCLIVWLALGVSALGQQPGSAGQDPIGLASAEKLVATGRLDEALKQLDTLAARQPEPSGVERLRGLIFYQQRNMASADTAYAKALTQDPGDLEAMQMRGVVLFSMGRPAEAIPLLERARTPVSRANVDPNYVLGVCYLETQRYDDARRAFALQYGFPPDSAPAYLLIGRMLLRRENPAQAEVAARKALSLQPNLPLAHLLMGEAALAQAQLPAAIAEFEKERELNPLYAGAYDRLGDAYLRLGDDEKAMRALSQSVVLDPASSGPYILLGKVMLNQQNDLMAILYLQRAVTMDPRNAMAHSLLGQAERRAGRAAEASQQFAIAEQLRSGTSTSSSTAPKLDSPH